MNPAKVLKCLLLLVTASGLTLAAPVFSAPPPKEPHHSPLADHLARAEASVKALDHHLAAAAEHKAHVADAKLVERARKLGLHHLHEPLIWSEYVRRVPSAIIVDSATYHTAELEAEKSAAALGDDLDALWARRKQVEAERMVLWSKIAFRSVAEMELSNQAVYRFELKSGDKPLDQQRLETLKTAVQFVRVVDHLAAQAEDAVDVDPRVVYVQWHKLLAAARLQMQDKMLSQALVAMDVYKADTDAGQLAANTKQLVDLAQTIVDAEHGLSAAEFAGDDAEADANRAQLQQALADTAGAVGTLDKSIGKAATVWAIAVIPGTKAAVGELPDLLGNGASATGGTAGTIGETVYLTDLKEVKVKALEDADAGFGKYGRLSNNKSTLITVNGAPSPHGLGLHPPKKGASFVDYALGGEYGKFEGAVALDDSSNALKSVVIFRITGDGRELWHSKPIGGPHETDRFSINIGGVDHMEIAVECPGDNKSAHAVWVEPALLALRPKVAVAPPVQVPVASPAPAPAPAAQPAPPPVAQPAPAPAAPVPGGARTEMVGKSHSATFQDDAPPGAVLVGFEFTTEKRKKKAAIICSARAVYRGPAGEVLGRQLGNPDGSATRVIARPGYAVASIEITTGAEHIGGIVLHYMRMNGNVAVPSDAYDESYGPHVSNGQKIGDNRPIIGLFGEAGSNIDKLGLIMRK